MTQSAKPFREAARMAKHVLSCSIHCWRFWMILSNTSSDSFWTFLLLNWMVSMCEKSGKGCVQYRFQCRRQLNRGNEQWLNSHNFWSKRHSMPSQSICSSRISLFLAATKACLLSSIFIDGVRYKSVATSTTSSNERTRRTSSCLTFYRSNMI